jgi:hypothetical protein
MDRLSWNWDWRAAHHAWEAVAMDLAVRHFAGPIGQDVTDGPNVDQVEGSLASDPETEEAAAQLVESAEGNEALFLLHEAHPMVEGAQNRMAASWEPLGQAKTRDQALALLREARGMTLGALHRMVDAIAILKEEQGSDGASP